MRKNILITSAIVLSVLLSACATNKGPTYDGNSYRTIKHYSIGTILAEKPVVISDDGSGHFFGALVGAVLGSTLGMGNGKTLATLGGGIAGYYAGSEIGKANGDELTIELDNGGHIVVVVKGKNFRVGDRVKIIKDGNRVTQVDLVN